MGTAGVATAYLLAFVAGGQGPAGQWLSQSGAILLAVAMPVTMLSVMLLASIRSGVRSGVRAFGWLLSLALVLVEVVGCFLAALLLPPDTATGPLWFGLPPRAAIILYGVGVAPLLILPLAYAWSFERLTLSADGLAQLRALRPPELPDR